MVNFGILWYKFNCLPNDEILDWTKLKAFADNKKFFKHLPHNPDF